MSDFYVYTYSCPVSKEPFYIGKGRGNRAWSHIKNAKKLEKNSHLYNKIRRMLEDSKSPIIRIVFKDLDEFDALIKEASLIAHYGRSRDGGCLCNLRKGWDGALSGLRPEKDDTIYAFKHVSGKVLIGTRRDLFKYDPSVKPPQLSSMINGKIRNTAGWFLREEHGNIVGASHNFLNIRTNEVIKNVTQTQFSKHTGIDSGQVSALVNGRTLHINWWCLEESEDHVTNEYIRVTEKHKFVHADGSVEFLTEKEASKKLGVPPYEIRSLIDKERTHLRGWFLDSVTEKKLSKYSIDGEYPFKFLVENCDTRERVVMTRSEIADLTGVHPKHVWNRMIKGGHPVKGWKFIEVVGFPHLYRPIIESGEFHKRNSKTLRVLIC